MSQSKDRRSKMGRFIRQLREQKAKSRDDLADDAKIWLRTLQEIELGKRTPQHRTLKKIASALDVPAEVLSRASMDELEDETTEQPGAHGQALSASVPLKLIAARFIPLFTGANGVFRESDGGIFRDVTTKEIVTHRFEDNFVVIELIDTLQFQSVFEVLTARRERHLSILNKELDFLNFGKSDYDNLLSGGRKQAEYVEHFPTPFSFSLQGPGFWDLRWRVFCLCVHCTNVSLVLMGLCWSLLVFARYLFFWNM